ncbi:MAG: hypothetical protein NC331_01495 [Lachnospiraceae bacterium]|nr:hypothetical protein [Lachnospiraceae bacterium]MCM1238041.1 hypothetical protein [Lachnospiraceae bacterium]
MVIDFSKITIYEVLALILAGVAILIPIIQWAWKKWAVKPVLIYIPTGRATLFFNQSGSYIRIEGVYEAKYKPISVKKIAVTIKRQRDDKTLNLKWSSFISPINQNVLGNYMQTIESAHPFRIEADSIQCAFTEFGDSYDSFGKTFRSSTSALFGKISEITTNYKDYSSAEKVYKDIPEYVVAKEILSKEFFWEIGKYSVDIEVDYGDENKHFSYMFSVGEQENKLLMDNIEEALVSPLKSVYGVNWDYHTAIVEI